MQLGKLKNGCHLTFKNLLLLSLLKLTPVQHRSGEGIRTYVRASASRMGCTNQRRIVVYLYKFQASCNGVCFFSCPIVLLPVPFQLSALVMTEEPSIVLACFPINTLSRRRRVCLSCYCNRLLDSCSIAQLE